MSRIGRTLATGVMVALSSWSCGSTAPDAAPQVATIIVTPSTSTLAINAQLPLQAQVQDGSGAVVPDAAVTWTVQDPKIVSVSASGVVTALAIGTSQVAANALGKSGLATVTVTRTPVANVVLLPNKIDATVGSTTQLSAVAYDGAGNALSDRAITWSSSNQAIATVSTTGLVTAVAAGVERVGCVGERVDVELGRVHRQRGGDGVRRLSERIARRVDDHGANLRLLVARLRDELHARCGST